MKKVLLILLAVVITGCSNLPVNIPFWGTPTAPAPVVIDSPGPTVTLVVSPMPTDTIDPFAIATKAPTETLDPKATVLTPTRVPSSTPTTRPTITLEPLDETLFTPSPKLFVTVQRSTDRIVWGSTCDGSRSIQFKVQVTPVLRMKYVLLFYRLQDKYSGRGTDWGGGAIMKDNDQGTYFYTLELDQIQDYRNFEDAWLQYQFVASTSYLKVLGRSVVDRTSLSLTHCMVLNP